MDIKKFYADTGSDYQAALSIMMNDVLIERMIKKFMENNSYNQIIAQIQPSDWAQNSTFAIAKTRKQPKGLITRVFICLWPRWTLVAVRASLVGVCGAPLHCGARAPLCSSLSWRPVRAQSLRCPGLVGLQQVTSSQTRDQTCVPCIGRWILNHITREVPFVRF